ncbi:hypothetical protein I7I51_02942 [Histoplasma capsulatum]|uniref:Uncharacterized protein n=1 Tax=Ajellomyces capsulatus TaxID=5037 RepID=A0A8A1MQ60_AJECA|nr:predicted protein [Histoplasma mississippiense (nom. inval.)]EDN11357.1 predicted protein [Histoplasma mississippiense (nom. inval.)]QSS66733.1 hypothetical protein I7I51_02942 [Histoplasma capsulatum]
MFFFILMMVHWTSFSQYRTEFPYWIQDPRLKQKWNCRRIQAITSHETGQFHRGFLPNSAAVKPLPERAGARERTSQEPSDYPLSLFEDEADILTNLRWKRIITGNAGL